MRTINDELRPRPATPPARLRQRPGIGGTGLLRALAAWTGKRRERREMTRSLHGLSDRELADIGLESRRLRDPPPRSRLPYNEVEEQVLADLGLSRILPPPH